MAEEQLENNQEVDVTNLDISDTQDLSVALMNLVSLEEHCFFSYAKTHKKKYLQMLESVRETRKKFMKVIVKEDDDSEKWCMSKHFLATSMRLYEVANKLYHEGNINQAEQMYQEAAEQYGMFWSLNSNNFNQEKLSEEDKEELNDSLGNIGKEMEVNEDSWDTQRQSGKKSVFLSIKQLLKCCME